MKVDKNQSCICLKRTEKLECYHSEKYLQSVKEVVRHRKPFQKIQIGSSLLQQTLKGKIEKEK